MAAYLVTTSKGNRLIEARTQASAINFVMASEVTAKNLSTTELIKHIKEGMTVETVNPEDVKPVLEYVEESIRHETAEEEGEATPETPRSFSGRFTKKTA